MEKNELIEKIDNFVSTLFGDDNKESDQEVEAAAMTKFTMPDGTVVAYQSLEPGMAIVAVTDQGDVPLPTGQYVINDMAVEVSDGNIVSVEPNTPSEEPPTETPEGTPAPAQNQEKENDVKASDELKATLKAEFDAEVEKIKADYEAKLEAEKNRIKDEVTKLANEVKASSLKQAPEHEKTTPSKPLTMKEIIMRDAEDKRNDLSY